MVQNVYYYVELHSETRRQPPNATAVSLKKGDFNIPSAFCFSKKENGGFDYFQNRRLAAHI